MMAWPEPGSKVSTSPTPACVVPGCAIHKGNLFTFSRETAKSRESCIFGLHQYNHQCYGYGYGYVCTMSMSMWEHYFNHSSLLIENEITTVRNGHTVSPEKRPLTPPYRTQSSQRSKKELLCALFTHFGPAAPASTVNGIDNHWHCQCQDELKEFMHIVRCCGLSLSHIDTLLIPWNMSQSLAGIILIIAMAMATAIPHWEDFGTKVLGPVILTRLQGGRSRVLASRSISKTVNSHQSSS
jgi:hypothetical protein